MKKHVLHPIVYLQDRKHYIDIHVYEACSMLWANDIKTYFSCQGGPAMDKKGGIRQIKASVVIDRKNTKKALKVLKEFNPKADDNLLFKRISIKFDASKAAKNIPVIIEQTEVTYKFIKDCDDSHE